MTALIDALEKLMAAQLEDHRQLLECLNRKGEAIATARIDTVSKLINDERVIVARISDVERHRARLARQIAQGLGLDVERVTVKQIAEAVGDEQASARLLAIAAQLRECMAEVKRKSSIVRTAAETLSRHMAGVMQTVHSALSRAGVYSQGGRVAMDGQMAHRGLSVDLKS